MLTLRALRLLSVESADALLKTKQRLVDLSTFSLSLLVVALAILCTLRTSQVDQQQLTALGDSLLLNLDLSDRVTSTRSVVSFSCMRSSHLITL